MLTHACGMMASNSAQELATLHAATHAKDVATGIKQSNEDATMTWDLCANLMMHLGADELNPGHAPAEVQAWLESLGLEITFRRFMQWQWPQECGDLGAVHLYSSQRMMDEEDADLLAGHRLLCVGSAFNGDPLVLDYSTDLVAPCFVSHEEWWPDKSQDPRRCMARIAPSLTAFWWRQAEGLFVPIDSSSAGELNTLLANEGREMRGPEGSPK
ncbi:MAG: hypothetical protein R3F29_04975 [Planctomycetota bacterium]